MRNNQLMKWSKCKLCEGRIYAHRPDSHICGFKDKCKEVCECGHSHVSLIGDTDGKPARMEKIAECDKCKCEEFK